MAGYALECALNSCILKLIDDTGLIFKDKKYLDKLAKCWTHDLEQLLDLAELTAEFGRARGRTGDSTTLGTSPRNGRKSAVTSGRPKPRRASCSRPSPTSRMECCHGFRRAGRGTD
jgi:hypothetical protein